jgi:hypothetical protein
MKKSSQDYLMPSTGCNMVKFLVDPTFAGTGFDLCKELLAEKIGTIFRECFPVILLK